MIDRYKAMHDPEPAPLTLGWDTVIAADEARIEEAESPAETQEAAQHLVVAPIQLARPEDHTADQLLSQETDRVHWWSNY